MTNNPLNIYPDITSQNTAEEEVFENILVAEDLRIERIISTGQVTPEGTWYDQEENEWVMLISGKASILFEGHPEINLIPGDYILIPSGCRHRVTYTSKAPPAVWLTVFYKK